MMVSTVLSLGLGHSTEHGTLKCHALWNHCTHTQVSSDEQACGMSQTPRLIASA